MTPKSTNFFMVIPAKFEPSGRTKDIKYQMGIIDAGFAADCSDVASDTKLRAITNL